MDEEDLQFRSKDEEIQYWKETAHQFRERVDELEKELEDFQEQSSQLEKELEKSLDDADKTTRTLRIKCNTLTLELDSCREKYDVYHSETEKQLAQYQKDILKYRQREEKQLKYCRELEQNVDDLERSQRAMIESVSDIETKLNSAIERNALLENELDEKDTLKVMVQRLKDEQRDMQQELDRQQRATIPDNDRILERVSSPIDSNKLSMETQTTPSSPIKMSPSLGQLPQSNRLSAINLVGDLLKKVGLEKWLCPGCGRVKCNCGVCETPTRSISTTAISHSLSSARS